MAQTHTTRHGRMRARRLVGNAVRHAKKIVPHTTKVGRAGAKKTVRAARVVHHHVAVKPHEYATNNWAWYARWHNWRWHKLVHAGVLAVYFLLIGGVVFNSFNTPSSALSTWTQTNWDGGVGTSTTNQYQSISNIDSTIANQLSLSKGSNYFSNSTFDSNVTGWNGYNKAFDNTQSYSASGSAKVTAGAVTSSVLYNQLSTNTVANQLNLVSSDINKDGLEDLIATTYVTSVSTEARVYLAQGDGTYGSATVLTTPTAGSYDLVAGDFTGDGWNDVIVTQASAGSGNKVAYFVNNGSGTLGAATEITITGGPTGTSRACAIEKGYIDNNASLDAALICGSGSKAFILLNNGSGGFTQANYDIGFSGSTPQRLALADVDGDGWQDIVYVGVSNCLVYVLPNNGGGFSAAVSTTLTQCGTSSMVKVALTASDVNGDGRADVVIGRRSGNGGTSTLDTYYTTVLMGAVGHTFTSQADYTGLSGGAVTTSDITTADLDKDGFIDIVQSMPTNNVVSFFKNNGNGTFAAKVDLSQHLSIGFQEMR